MATSMFALPFPTFSVPSLTHNAGTVIDTLVRPYRGADGVPSLYSADGNWVASWLKGYPAAWTHLTSIVYTTSSTAHTVTVMRPLNYTTITTAESGGTTLILKDDPGIYSTNYKYPGIGGIVAAGTGATAPQQGIADNGIAGSDYVVYQLADGSWLMDTVSSVATLTLTMTTTIPGKVSAGAVLFFYGVTTDSDPATGQAHWSTVTTASTNRINLLNEGIVGGLMSHHPGDPMIVHSNNATAAGSVDMAAGYYARH